MSYTSDLRAFFKPEGSNPEIDSAFYELASQEKIHGMWNCEMLSLGFKLGTFSQQLRFRPIDPTKPIVFAIDGVTDGCYFNVIDCHVELKKPEGGMQNYKPFKTDAYIIDCFDGSGIGQGKLDYWSITANGFTFAHVDGKVNFPDTWVIHDCSLLCAFIGGGITANELRALCYRVAREVVKEVRREEHIRRLSGELEETSSQLFKTDILLKASDTIYANLKRRLSKLTLGQWPWMSKAMVKDLLTEHN